MSKTHVFDRFDVGSNRLDDEDIERWPCSDGYWVKAQDAIDREAVLQAQIRTLEATLEATKRAALAGMDAATSASSVRLEEAARLRAESSPEALASERAANAILTAENERLSALVETARAAALEDAAKAVAQHNRAGREWVADSLWGNLTRESAARIRALKEKA
jgi:hypothetical protein